MAAEKKTATSDVAIGEKKITKGKQGKSDNQTNPLLAWNSRQSAESLQEMRSKAGIASGAARRAKGDLVGRLRNALESDPDSVVQILMQILQDDSRPTLQLKAAELVFKVAGLMTENVTIKQEQPFVTLDLSSMSDADLMKYADQQIIDEEK